MSMNRRGIGLAATTIIIGAMLAVPVLPVQAQDNDLPRTPETR